MAQTTALQHVYSRVEKSKSPRGLAGYQTLFFTQPGLTEGEARALEARLVYFPTDASPPKWLFFVAPSGRPVVAQIASAHAADQQRKRIGVAHSLVLPADVLTELAAGPFGVLDRFRFLQTLEEALAAGDPPTGHIPALDVEVVPPQDPRALSEGWCLEELQKLAFLALRAGRLAEQRLALAVVGTPEEILRTLRLAHLLLPGACAVRCTFDTYFVDDAGKPCNLAANYFWAVGLPQRPLSGNYVVVDAAARTVQHEGVWQAADAYEGWLQQRLAEQDWEDLVHGKNAVYAFAQFLDTGRAAPAMFAPAAAEVLPDLFRKHWAQLLVRVQDALAGGVPMQLAKVLAEPVCRQATAAGLLRGLQQGFEPGPLLELLYLLYAQRRFAPPEEEETLALGRALASAETPHARLALLHACWTGRQERTQAILRRLPEDEAEEFLSLALAGRLPQPLILLEPETADLFVRQYVKRRLHRRVPLPLLVRSLLRLDVAETLVHLAPLVGELTEDDLHELRRTIQPPANIPAPFAAAVADAWEVAQENAGTVARWLRKLWP